MRRILFLLMLLNINGCNLFGVGDDPEIQSDGPSCDDSIKNGSETDIDCGGDCGGCGIVESCIRASDCLSGICTARICVDFIVDLKPNCQDAIANQNETDVDCGGPCQGCEIGDRCTTDPDCASSNCDSDGRCQISVSLRCENNKLDDGEVEIDCGGSCTRCMSGACQVSSDCNDAERCVRETCTQWQQNGHNRRVRMSVDNTGTLEFGQITIGAKFPIQPEIVDPESLIVITDDGESRPVFVESWTQEQKFFWFNAPLIGDTNTSFWLYYSENAKVEPAPIENVFPDRIGVWPMADNRDVVGGRNLAGASLVRSAGINGLGLAYDDASFNTIEDSAGLSVAMGTTFSISMWGIIDPTSGSQTFFARPLTTDSNNDIWIGWESRIPPRWSCWMSDVSQDNIIMRDDMLSVGADGWVQLVVTYDGSRAITYANGIQFGTSTFVKGSSPPVRKFMIGADSNNGGVNYTAFMDGVLDDLQIYSTVLSQNEIKFSFNNRGGARVSFSQFERAEP